MEISDEQWVLLKQEQENLIREVNSAREFVMHFVTLLGPEEYLSEIKDLFNTRLNKLTKQSNAVLSKLGSCEVEQAWRTDSLMYKTAPIQEK